MRKIEFHQGLNLVIDDSTSQVTESGNNVGKTTFLRALDYCLGGEIESAFEDRESGLENDVVRNDLESNEVLFRLEFGSGKSTHLIERGWKSNPILDGIDYPLPEFNQRLNELFFGLKAKKPSFRQLIGKFVRIEPHQISNTLKFLYHRTASEDYEPIFLFLFGEYDPEMLTLRRNLFKDLRDLEIQRKAFKAASKKELVANIRTIREKIKDLETQRERLEVSPIVGRELAAAGELQRQVAVSEARLAQSELVLVLGQQTLKELESANAHVDPEILRRVYDEAKAHLPDLHRSYEDVVVFSERLVANKSNFVSEQMAKEQVLVAAERGTLAALLAKLEPILKRISSKQALAGLEKIQAEMSALYQELGSAEAMSKKLAEVEAELGEVKKKLAESAEMLDAFDEQLKENVAIFNRHFGKISKALYDEVYRLVIEAKRSRAGDIKYSFWIENVGGNEGAGKKRAQVTAFDLAFIAFAAQSNIRAPRFALHDRLEEIHDNQLTTLLRLSDEVPGQYIIAILRGRLVGFKKEWVDKHQVLVLSERDRFLRIEQ